MVNTANIKERMEVIGSDGHHVGRVDHIHDTELELAKVDIGSGLRHHTIPISWVDFVDDDKVRLNIEAAEARAAWRPGH